MSDPRHGQKSGGEDGFAIAALGILLALQIAGDTILGLRRVAALRIETDEAEGVCLRLIAQGPLAPGTVEGRFSNGRPWTLTVRDSRPTRLGPPLWRIRLSHGGPDGAAHYTTLVPGKQDA